MRNYSVAAPLRVSRPIYRVDLSVGTYCARPCRCRLQVSADSAGWARSHLHRFFRPFYIVPPRRSRLCLSGFEPSPLGVSTPRHLGSSSASGFSVCGGVSSGSSQGLDICLGVVRSSSPFHPVSAASFHPIRVGPRVGTASAPPQVVRSAFTLSWVFVVRSYLLYFPYCIHFQQFSYAISGILLFYQDLLPAVDGALFSASFHVAILATPPSSPPS
ncbi:hypothetical protein NDU88_002168 [Pleurodeles waltl]|uniref:Uncharacterized protein n=1 Tax=Pleurodeles waltl TaxID=8319 RepID=A0AAV7WKM2_PLEWA|nr:hypothetical protein NDU88_002168 [Pleurodeles waltl]